MEKEYFILLMDQDMKVAGKKDLNMERALIILLMVIEEWEIMLMVIQRESMLL